MGVIIQQARSKLIFENVNKVEEKEFCGKTIGKLQLRLFDLAGYDVLHKQWERLPQLTTTIEEGFS